MEDIGLNERSTPQNLLGGTDIDFSHVTYNPNSETTVIAQPQNGLQVGRCPREQKRSAQVVGSWALEIVCWTLGVGCVASPSSSFCHTCSSYSH
jgi:hypothetical protein